MRHFFTKLGGTRVKIVAPRPGTLDPAVFAAAFPPGGLYGLDIESTFMRAQAFWDPAYEVRTVQVATADEGWVLRMDDEDQLKAVTDLLTDPRVEFCSHTQTDTLGVLVALDADIRGRNLDTHWLAVMASPDDTPGAADLKGVAVRFGMPELKAADARLDVVFERIYREAHPEIGRKAVKKETLAEYGFNHIDLDDPVFLGYAGLDAIAVRRVAPRLVSATRAPVHLLRRERWLSEQVTDIRVQGLRVDVEALEALEATTAATVEAAASVVAEHTDGLKPTQTAKLIDFWTAQGASWRGHPRSPKTNVPTLAKENAKRLLTYDMSPEGQAVARAYIEHAGVLDRLRKTHAIRDGMDLHGYLHPTLYSVGTVTGRMSAAEPNMQNFAKKDRAMRGLFLPRPGHILISCDFAQIELRVLAALAREAVMIEVITGNGDLHQLTADLLGITRQEAKTVNFLIVYGGGGKRLAMQLNYSKSDSECYEIISEYWEKYPAISALRDELCDLEDEVILISGRRVPVGTTKDGGSRSYANLNYKIQGSARELLVGAWYRYAARGGPGRVWLPIHDELVVEAREEHAEAACAAVSDSMTFTFRGVPIVAEADPLIDEQGVSRWMPGDLAREIRLAA